MVVNYDIVRQIVLNDRFIGYKPDRLALNVLATKLPDMNVIGFGVYQTTFAYKIWYVLVESSHFLATPYDGIPSISIKSLPVLIPKTSLILVPNKNPGDSSA